MKRKEVLIYGWFGVGNLGDELILRSVLSFIREIDSDIKINVMGVEPKNIKRYHPNINLVSPYVEPKLKSVFRLVKFNLLDTILNFRFSKVLIAASGGAISDWNPSSTSTLFFLINLYKKILRRPIILIGVGAGPIINEDSKPKFRKYLSLVDIITVRDKESFDVLKDIGLDNLYLANDCVFDLQDNFLIPIRKTSESTKIGIVIAKLFAYNKEKYERYKADIVEYISLLNNNGYAVTLIPFHYNYDIEFLEEIQYNVRVKIDESGQEDFWKLIDVIKAQDIIVGMRYHSVILSIILEKPVLPIIYHAKVYSVVEEFGLLNYAESIGDGVNWNESNIDVTRLFNNTEYVVKNISSEIQNLKDKLNKKRKNELNITLLREVLHNNTL